MRKVLLGGVIGALPGGLFLLVVFVLETTDVISSDASQIGFIGLPVLFLGTLIGVWIGGSGTPHAGKVAAWTVVGGVAGIVAGFVTGVPVLWLVLGPIGMIAGGVLGAQWGERRAGLSSPTEPGTS
jgi:hypothetical protein